MKSVQELIKKLEETDAYLQGDGYAYSSNQRQTLEATIKYLQALEHLQPQDQEKERNVYGNSDAFRNWLTSEAMSWKGNGHHTTIYGDVDLFQLGAKWGKYKELNQPKAQPQRSNL